MSGLILAPTILVVEDEEDILGLLKSGLEENGYRVFTADSISKAQFLLSNQVYQCVISDLKIRQGNMTSLLDILNSERGRRHPTHPLGMNRNTPFVILSGNLDTNAVKKIASLTPHILAKPFKIAALIEIVRKLAPPELLLTLPAA